MRVLGIGLVCAAALLAASGSAQPTEIEQAIRARLDAYSRRDAAAWGRFVADDCLCGGSTKAAIQAEMKWTHPSVKITYGPIEELQQRHRGKTVVVQYRITEHIEVGSRTNVVRQQRMETYHRGDRGKWLLVAGIDMPVPADPAVAEVDPAVYDALAGRYEYAPGTFDVVTREGDRLLWQPSGQPKEELFPEDETTYFAKGQGWRIVFRRDEQDVLTLVFRQNGQEFVAKKVE